MSNNKNKDYWPDHWVEIAIIILTIAFIAYMSYR